MATTMQTDVLAVTPLSMLTIWGIVYHDGSNKSTKTPPPGVLAPGGGVGMSGKGKLPAIRGEIREDGG